MFYPGDTYNFILNIPTTTGTPTITSAPIITVLDITNPSVPIVSGASMTFITGTSFIYFYSFAVPNISPKDYVALYTYAVSNAQSVGTATAVGWNSNVGSYTFPLPLPTNVIPGSLLTTTGFSSGGSGSYNVTNQSILSVNQSTGVITVAIATNPGSIITYGTGTALVNTTISNQTVSSTDKLHIGDSYVTGQVALATAIVPNVITALTGYSVMKSSQYVAPNQDPAVQTINTNVASVLSNTNTVVSVLGTLNTGTVSGLLQDVYDNVFGSWNIDQTQNPPVLYIKRINGSTIASFQLVNNSNNIQRNVLTSPPESNY